MSIQININNLENSLSSIMNNVINRYNYYLSLNNGNKVDNCIIKIKSLETFNFQNCIVNVINNCSSNKQENFNFFLKSISDVLKTLNPELKLQVEKKNRI